MVKNNYHLIVILISSVLLRFFEETANLSIWIIGIAAILGPSEIIISLLFSWLLLSLNISFLPNITEFGVLGRYFNIIVAIIFLLKNYKCLDKKNYNNLLILLLILFIFHSIFFSNNILISISKSILLISVLFVLIYSWYLLNQPEKIKLLNNIIKALYTIAILSLLLINSKYGRSVNGIGFEGILNHPQVFGIFMSILCSICIIKILKNPKLISINYLIFPFFFLLLTESKSRTALFSFLIASSFIILIKILLTIKKKLSLKFLIPLLVSLSLAIITFTIHKEIVQINSIDKTSSHNSGNIHNESLDNNSNSKVIESFNYLIFKDSKTDDLKEIYSISRGEIINKLFIDIKSNYLFGTGFGVGNISQSSIKYIPSTNIIISYPIEKSVLPLAIIHELGIFGFFILLLLIIYSLKIYFQIFNCSVLIIITIFLLNFGEFTLLSTGGVGLLQIIFLTFFISESPHVEKNKCCIAFK